MLKPKVLGRHRHSKAALVLIAAAVLLLAGIGNRIIDNYQALADANTLAAVSLAVSGVPRNALPVTLVDIDDRTRDAWNARPKIPHAALAILIGIASERGAEAIILDVDLSGDTAEEPPDPQLRALLSAYPADGPMLMLARRIVFSATTDGRMEPTSSLRTPYDAIVHGKPNIQWITTLNDIDRDRSVRRVRLWQSVCAGGDSAAYPSAALMAGAMLLPPPSQAFSLQHFLSERVAGDCENVAAAPAPWPGAQRQAATVPYILPDRADARALFRVVRNGAETLVLRRVTAGQIVSVDGPDARPAGEIDAHPFTDRVVMIGASDAASGDVYNTPMGSMPGVLIIANSVVQADRILNARPMPPVVRAGTILLALLSFILVARLFQGAVAALVISAISFLLLYATARLFSLGDGIAVLAAAVTGVALFKLLESLLNLALEVPKRGWRAIFKS
jgi:CHASE2 domain-containing sensor protein